LYDKKKQGDQKCGLGPVLTYGPAVQNNLLKMIIQVADKNKISFQRAAASRSTGTDTESFAYSGEGVPSALISLPLKYMHTTVETVNKKDVDQVVELMYRFLVQLKSGHDFRYIK
jgi:putative aminopeptidase FrvX